jgi:hypothetical protein
MDQLSDTSPYSLVEIEDYLFINHYHWVLSEKSTTFVVSGPHAQKQDADRRYWLFEAHDSAKHRQWFVVVGTGKSPFDPSERMKRWMLCAEFITACPASVRGIIFTAVVSKQRAMKHLRELDPTLRVSNLADWLPIRRPEDLATFAGGLRKAGLPE